MIPTIDVYQELLVMMMGAAVILGYSASLVWGLLRRANMLRTKGGQRE